MRIAVPGLVLSLASLIGALVPGCAAQRAEARLAPLAVAQPEAAAAVPKPALLVDDHFVNDHAGTITEAQLKEILKAPVFLESQARIGIVPVSDGYGADESVPLTNVTGALGNALDASGQFEVVTEVSTDFPATGSVAGLRELAARYRADYLLLYRHRFVDAIRASGWAWSWATLVGPLALPVNTLESEGVLEATLFDTKSGTILFTAFARTRGEAHENAVDVEYKQKKLKEKLLVDATKALTDDVVEQIGRLSAARVAYDADEGSVALKEAP